MSRPRLRHSVVVVTGASSGIGRATALAFARRGATVVAAARRGSALRKLAQACERHAGRALAVPTDVTDEKAVRKLADRALETYGRIDVWVNDAAVSAFGRFEETPADAFRRVVDVNFFGYVHGARAALPVFHEQGSGVLVNVSSIVASTGQPYTTAYNATKYAIRGLAQSLRMELMLDGHHDIHVCTVLPGVIDTPLFQQSANFTGRVVSPMSPVRPAGKVAAAIVRLARHPRREVFVGGLAERLLLAQNLLLPGLTERFMARKVDRDHFQDRPVRPTQGNLHEPIEGLAQVAGGWRREPLVRRAVRGLRPSRGAAARAAETGVPAIPTG